MKHGIKKIKFRRGQDANQALMRKLSTNFVKHGKLETTLSRAKAVKSSIDSLANKAKERTEARNSLLLSKFGDPKIVEKMFSEVGPSFKNRTGGFVRLTRLGKRQGDNAEMALIEWTKEVAKAAEPTTEKKTPAKKTTKAAEKKATSKKSEK